MQTPGLKGPHGKAWLAAYTEAQLKEAPAAVCGWLLHCPPAHPFWDWYTVFCVHLRDVPGADPAKKRSENMSHEILIYALDPSFVPAVDTPIEWIQHRLEGPNLLHQLELPTDADASRLVALLIQAFCDGTASPDSDWRRHNKGLLDGTAEHVRSGRHGVS